ncbi:MAG: hypothetical protein ACI902_001501, partial [Psychroserpens sp.]
NYKISPHSSIGVTAISYTLMRFLLSQEFVN